MKSLLSFCVSAVILAFTITACQLIQFPPSDQQSINLRITDLDGKELKEVYGGQAIRLISPFFKTLNSNGDLLKEGKIMFDEVPADIKLIQGDVIVLTLPYLYYVDPAFLRLRLLLRNDFYELCANCVIYTPTITGRVFTGIVDGEPDGTFNLPAEMTNDAVGNLYVIDQQTTSSHDRVLKVTSAGVTTILAGGSDEFGRLVGIAIDQSRGLVYVSDATSQQIKSVSIASPSTISVVAGNGTAGNTDGTGASASFNFGSNRVDNFGISEVGQGLTIDGEGNLYAGENFDSAPFGSQVRMITPAGVVSTVPGSRIEPMDQPEAASPAGITIRNDGTLFYVGGGSGFFQGITQLTDVGSISRLAGKISFEGLDDGIGTDAQFSYPKAIQSFGEHLYVADGTNGALRKVTISTGEVISLAGIGHFDTPYFCACDYGPPVSGSYTMPLLVPSGDTYYAFTESRARNIVMNQVGGLAVINPNLIYVSDYEFHCLWKIEIR